MNIGATGKSGEDRVVSFLRKQGWGVVKRNYQCRFGEIDIIAEKEKYVIFVEVKTRKENSMIPASDAVDIIKQQKIMLTAQDYMQKTDTKLQPRFDVAEVTVKEKTDGSKGYSLKYIENAF